MDEFDFCVAWNWEYDADFVALLEVGCQSRGLSMFQITPGNLAQALHSLAEQGMTCRVFLDRASDVDPQFMPLCQWVHENNIIWINSYERASRTWDKAKTHDILLTAGLDVPQTIFLPAYFEQPELPCMDLLVFGEQFTIKPAHGSGGVGVMMNATTWEQVITTRKEHATDQYLLQAHVTPKELETRPAWFRVIYCTGQAYPCWWNPHNHVYYPVTQEDKDSYGLSRLEDITATIAHLFGLDLFSTEIALTSEGQFIVVDYVNDQIDLRLQSKVPEGVPDDIVHSISERLVSQVLQLHY
jgi:hypothetical protein